MHEGFRYGVRCKCGELIAVTEIEQEDDVPIETLRDRLRRAGWTKIIQHSRPDVCTAGKIYYPDEVVRMG